MTATIAPGKAHTGYRHEALLYAGEQGFLDAVVPFVADGVARAQPVMVAVSQPRITALQVALGTDAAQVTFVDMAALGANPARLIPAWQDFVNAAAAPARGVSEPIWQERSPDEIVECQLQESLLNLAVGPDVPLWLVCPYDVQSLDGELIAARGRAIRTANDICDLVQVRSGEPGTTVRMHCRR